MPNYTTTGCQRDCITICPCPYIPLLAPSHATPTMMPPQCRASAMVCRYVSDRLLAMGFALPAQMAIGSNLANGSSYIPMEMQPEL